MADNRQLWTGPFGAALADRALDLVPADPANLWIVPTKAAGERALCRLARRHRVLVRPRVWCWDDLWRAVRSGSAEGPMSLSPAGERAVLGEAITETRRAGGLRLVGDLADAPGYRRRLRARIAAWTRQEIDPDGPPPGDEIGAEEWAVFARYRRLLKRLDAVDAEALAAWASWILKDDPPPDLRRFGYAAILDATILHRTALRAIGHFEERAQAVLATLPFDPDPTRADAFAAASAVRDLFLDRRYTETEFPDESSRPAALVGIERELFRDDAHKQPKLPAADGLALVGAPEGEGIGAVVARRVRGLLEGGEPPEEVLVLVPRWDEQAEVMLETLRSWGLPTAAEADRPLANDPDIAVLRLAVSLPIEDFETDRVVRLLRNVQVRPDWVESTDPLALPVAASAVRATRVFRGGDAVRDALRRASGFEPKPGAPPADERRRERRAARARAALPVFEGLTAAFRDMERPAPWGAQVHRLTGLAGRLGLEGTGLGHLLDALDDQGTVLDGLGRGKAPWTWVQFAREVEALVADGSAPPPPIPPGSVRVATVDQAEGLRARHVLLANLGEGTFPRREAVDPDPDDLEGEPARLALSREMLRFLRAAGSADASLALVFPTSDVTGEPRLAAGFLEEVRRLFEAEGVEAVTTRYKTRDVAASPDLAGSPAELRARAVGAAFEGDPTLLRRLSASPRHRPALEGTAAALRVSHRRMRDESFGPYDGLLADPDIATRIAEAFGPARPTFSASQLESLAFCPFQFFLRYVLHLEPTEEREELDEDHAGRGSLVHDALEKLHTLLRDTPADGGESLLERLAAQAEALLLRGLEGDGRMLSQVEEGLRAIERGRLILTARRYVHQFKSYVDKYGARAECHQFEVAFGKPGESEHAGLMIGPEGDGVQLQGMIDRIDLVRLPGQTLFRVIDYKTGSTPGAGEIDGGLALQLPLYALAAERIILAGEGALPLDIGYWALKDRGFRSVKAMARVVGEAAESLEDWAAYRRGLEAYVLDLVARLRQARFPVAPRSDDCTRFCDYRDVCRIKQVRSSGKVWEDRPKLEPIP